MPRFDGMGPEGKGSKTGRGLGKCSVGKHSESSFGRDLGRGLGRNGDAKA